MAKKEEPYDTWRYRRTASGKISAQIFRSDSIPPGWVDSPAKCKEKAGKKAPEPDSDQGK